MTIPNEPIPENTETESGGSPTTQPYRRHTQLWLDARERERPTVRLGRRFANKLAPQLAPNAPVLPATDSTITHRISQLQSSLRQWYHDYATWRESSGLPFSNKPLEDITPSKRTSIRMSQAAKEFGYQDRLGDREAAAAALQSFLDAAWDDHRERNPAAQASDPTYPEEPSQDTDTEPQ